MEIGTGINNFLFAAAIAFGCLLASRQLIHWFQLESYQFPGYFRTLKRQGIKAWGIGPLYSIILMAGMLCIRFFLTGWTQELISLLLPLIIGTGILILSRQQKTKKALVYTPRIKRLYVVCVIVFFLTEIVIMQLGIRTGTIDSWTLTACLLIPPVLLPLWVALGGLLAWPIEKIISEMYFRDAQRILREQKDLIRIGITGSWGKTSVKFILGSLLSERYPTLVTPASFNTPMGVTKVIRNQLEPGHRIFIAEMGARHVGDIKEMCRLVHPQIGLITSIGPQHLDTFHTQERITKTKYELIQSIPKDGSCFFSDDDGIVTTLWGKTKKEKVLTGMDPEKDDVWAENLKFSPEGCRFLLCTKEEKISCETELLGELNIRNIVLCAGVCLKLGMNGKEIARGIRKLQPVEHRLELKRNPGGITVLDDAFNSNIRGARQAFQVLKEFPGKRIVVTPGMVELGEQEEDLNREFGYAMAGCCDLAILVGKKRSKALREGLLSGGFDDDRIRIVASLQEAADLLRSEAVTGDIILFENDLPDNYSEE